MLTIRGTQRNDDLYAPDSGARILGGRGHDVIEGRMGNDILYGGADGDYLYDWQGGYNRMYGGRGDDRIDNINGEAWGGVGNDHVYADGLAVGGKGDDIVIGSGQLFGDEGPGLQHKVAGNDTLIASSELLTQLTGGLGHDTFQLMAALDGVHAVMEVMDFTPGQDLITASEHPLGVPGTLGAAIFNRLDANHNGVLEWSDSLGADGDWNTLDGSPVYTDGHSMYIGLGWTYAGPTSNDAEDMLVVHGTSQITAADWVMT